MFILVDTSGNVKLLLPRRTGPLSVSGQGASPHTLTPQIPRAGQTILPEAFYSIGNEVSYRIKECASKCQIPLSDIWGAKIGAAILFSSFQ